MKQELTYRRALRLAGVCLLTAVTAPTMAGAAPPESITIVLPEEPLALELCDSGSPTRRITQGNVAESLTFLEPDTKQLEPWLATSWQQIEPTLWRLQLRENVKFHDGQDLTAAAVVTSLNRAWTPVLACGVRQQFFQSNVYTARAVDGRTIEITTEKPDPILPLRLSFLGITSPATPLGTKTLEPIGTGPYRFVSWTKGERIRLERFKGYWGPAPVIESAQYQFRQESSIRAAMAQTGEADLAHAIAPQDVRPEDWSAGRAMNFELPGVTLLRFDLVTPLPPMDDIRIRRAINLAIDRQDFLDVVFDGHGSLANHAFVPATNGFNPKVPSWEFRPDEARKLIAAARDDGVPVDQEIVLYGRLGVYENATEGMELVAAMLKDVGLKVRVEMLGLQAWARVLRSTYQPGRQVNMMQQSHENQTGDAIFTFSPQYSFTGPFSALRDQQANEMITEALSLSGAERTAALQKISYRLYTEVIPDAPLVVVTSTMMTSGKITYKPNLSSFEEVHLKNIRPAR